MENCSKYQERISALLDGMLPEEERLELLEHMANCPACQAYFDDQTAIHNAMTSLDAQAPAGFTETMMARVRETKQDAPANKVIAFPHWRRWAATAACCAAAVLGIIGLGGPHELGPAANRDLAAYSLSRTEDTSAPTDTSAESSAPVTYTASTNEPAAQTESVLTDEVAACSLPDDAPRDPQPASGTPAADARIEESQKSTEAAAKACALLTSSPLAKQWVEGQLGQSWQPGRSYALTAEQFSALRALLDDACAAYTLEEAEGSVFLLLAQA